MALISSKSQEMVVSNWAKVFVLLTTSLLPAYGQDNPLHQTVSINSHNQTIEGFFAAIERQANVKFAYNPDIFSYAEKINFEADNVRIDHVLKQVLPEYIDHKYVGKHIILTSRQPEERPKQTKTIVSGRILARNTGEPVEFALVYDINTLKNVQTDVNGNFELEASTKTGQVELSVSRKNFADTVLVLGPNAELTQLDLALNPLQKVTPVSFDTTFVLTRPVEEISLVRFVTSQRQASIMSMTEEQLTHRFFQISFLPFFGSNGMLSGKVINNFPINIFGGYSAGLSGVEVGSFNIIRHDARGLQVGGFGNIVGGGFSGLQLGGFFNFTVEEVKGLQLSGFSNTAFKSMNGVQFSGFVNSSGLLYGLQWAGFANFSFKSEGGVQLAGFTNFNGKGQSTQFSGFANVTGEMSGFQGSGFVNVSLNDSKGVQAAGFANITNRRLLGVQFSGFMNVANITSNERNLKNFINKRFRNLPLPEPSERDTLIRWGGAQLTGAVNINGMGTSNLQIGGLANATGKLSGLQVAGLLNMTVKKHNGVQLAGLVNMSPISMNGLQVGFLNIAGNVKGGQIGFINMANDMKGIPIGFLSLVLKGYHTLEVATDDMFQLNLAAKTGMPYFYNILYFGQGRLKDQTIRGMGYGIGSRSPWIKQRASFSVDVITKSIAVNKWLNDETNLNTTLSALFNFKIINGLSVFAGPTFNHLIIDSLGQQYSVLAKGRKVGPLIRDQYAQHYWSGFRAGIRLL